MLENIIKKCKASINNSFRNNVKNINVIGEKYGFTHYQFYFILGFFALWLAGCFALLIPPLRNLVIRFGEVLVHRSLNHPVWHERFIFYSGTGIVVFIIIFACFILYEKKLNILSLVFLLLCEFVIMYKAGWIFSDDHQYISTTAINKYVSFYFGGGRFNPLSYIQYNIPLFIFRCFGINTGLPVEAHFAIVSLFFFVTFISLYFIIKNIEQTADKLSEFGCIFLCAFVFLSRSFSSVFLQLIFPETQVIMWFSLFMLMYYKALKTDKIGYYALAFFSAVYSTYCKEPVFGVFLVVAFVNYLFRYNKKSKREIIFYLALVANGILFIILYYFLSFKNAAQFYNEGRVSISRLEFLMSIFGQNPALIIMFSFGIIRLYFILFKKDKDHLFYDSLLFAGIAYTFAYAVVLHLNAGYYFLPSIILFLPSLFYWIKYLFEIKRIYALFLLIILLFIYKNNLIQTVEQISGIYRYRQEFLPYITDLLSEHNNGKEFIWYESDNRLTDNTFYIAVRNWRKYTENAFLNYLNKSENIDFFVVTNSMEHTSMDRNILLFYPVDNDQYQPIPDNIATILQDNNFLLYKDSYGVLIYKQH